MKPEVSVLLKCSDKLFEEKVKDKITYLSPCIEDKDSGDLFRVAK